MSDDTATTTPATPAGSAETQRTRVARKWSIKMVIFAVVLIGFGLWGFYDATVAYPKRGAEAAEYFEWKYLREAERTRGAAAAGIPDPDTQWQRISALPPQSLASSPVDKAMHEWLESLDRIGRLTAENTSIPRDDFRGFKVTDGVTRLSDLERTWGQLVDGKQKTASPLKVWDIPSQWAIMAIGIALGLYMVFIIVRVYAKHYTWAPATMTLGLPGGHSLTPADLADVDKRKWDKFFVSLVVKPGHATLGGKEVALDLLRYEPLEDWVLEMEKAAFPDRVKAEEEARQAREERAQETGETEGQG